MTIDGDGRLHPSNGDPVDGSSPHFNCSSTDKSGCINEAYDARAYFDNDTQRFWIVTAARNQVWTPCKDVGKCKPACGNHQQCTDHAGDAGNASRRCYAPKRLEPDSVEEL